MQQAIVCLHLCGTRLNHSVGNHTSVQALSSSAGIVHRPEKFERYVSLRTRCWKATEGGNREGGLSGINETLLSLGDEHQHIAMSFSVRFYHCHHEEYRFQGTDELQG